MDTSTPSKVRKTTYSRRKRRDSVAAEDLAESSEVQAQEDDPDTARGLSAKKKSEKKPTPKKVDVFLAPPDSKRSRFVPDDEVEASYSKPISKTSAIHRTRTVSNSSVDVTNVPTSSPISKPKSSVGFKKPKSKASLRHPSPVSAEDKDKPPGENTKPGGRVYRTEAQRIEFFKEQPNCGDFEPHRAFCKRCDRWIKLTGAQTYPVASWNKHVERCNNITSAKSDESDGAEEVSEDDKISVAPSTLGNSSRKRNEEQRRMYLEADSGVQEIKDYEVQCRACQRWIKLGNKRKYMLYRWEHHKQRCSDPLLATRPSGRVATANRKLQLVNDSQAKHFTSQSVECAICTNTIVLEGDGEYILATWQDHKLNCPKSSPTSRSAKSAQSSPIVQNRPPASVASTDITVVASEGSPPMRKGEKRRREPDATEDDDRPSVRARTETYVPTKGYVAGIMDWVTLPFKTFMRGFREGLGSGPPSGT